MQIAAGVQGDGSVVGLQLVYGFGGHDVLLDVFGGDVEFGAKLGARFDQLGVVFQAGKGLPLMGKASAEVAFA
jgi:hypothetical protein